MNFSADESVDHQIVDRLRQDGHAGRYVAEMEPGISDDIVLDLVHGITRPTDMDCSYCSGCDRKPDCVERYTSFKASSARKR